MSNAEPKSPLTIIAIFAGIIEASALASLPFLSEDSQTTYTWFLVGFPFFLTVLFFLTLNFNYKSLYSPPAKQATGSRAPQPPAQLSTALDNLISEAIQAAVEAPSADEICNISENNEVAAHRPEQSTQCVQTSVIISISGASAGELLEHFAMQALHHTLPPCNTWILNNLQTGIQTTLTTRPIDN
jgi:hypothetical protein